MVVFLQDELALVYRRERVGCGVAAVHYTAGARPRKEARMLYFLR
jgi:hypothetical protein